MHKKGFSFVEVIIVITLLILLAVIGVTVNNQYKEQAENTRINSDVETLKNSFLQYQQENSTLPLPGGNTNYFGSGADYVHSDDANAFGVYGLVTQNILPKKYLNYLPVDPRTQQYYAYGKTVDNASFEIAGVTKDNLSFISEVAGNYSGENGPLNLIREYNGPDFVFDGSEDNFPYNPEEKALTAKIISYSGSVSINDSITDENQILTYTLRSGDSILVGIGGYANIYFGDGSVSTLGDTTTESRLKIATIEFAQNDNLTTKILLALNIGSLWTQAAKQADDSSFEIYTSDTTAAVRGTEFGVSKENTLTNITVKNGKLKVGKLNFVGSLAELADAATSAQLSIEAIDIAGVTSLAEENGVPVSFIESVGDIAKGISIQDSGNQVEDTITKETKKDITNNIGVKLISIVTNTGTPYIKLYIPERALNADYMILKDVDTGNVYTSGNLLKTGNELTIPGTQTFHLFESLSTISGEKKLSDFIRKTIQISLCKFKKCTRPITLKLSPDSEVGVGEIEEIGTKENSVCNLSFANPFTGRCYINMFAQDLYELVGILDYTNRTMKGNIFGKDGKILVNRALPTSDEDFAKFYKNVDGKTIGIEGNSVSNLKIKYYGLSPIQLEKDFIMEFQLNGNGFALDNKVTLLEIAGKKVEFRGGTDKKFYIDSKEYPLPTSLYTNISSINAMFNVTLFLGSDTNAKIQIKQAGTTNMPYNIIGDARISSGEWMYIGGSSNYWPGLIKGVKIYRKVPPINEGTDKGYIKRKGTTPLGTPPSVNAGGDKTLIVGGATTVSITDAQISDPDGSMIEYIWSKLSGPVGGDIISPTTGTGTSPISPLLSLDNLSNLGTYVYQLIGTSDGESSSDTVNVELSANAAPVINTLPSISLTFPTSTTSNITAVVNDPNGDPMTYQWTYTPPSGCIITANFTAPTSLTTKLQNLKCPGDYTVKFKATDSQAAYSEKTFTVTLNGTVSGNGCDICPFSYDISNTNRDNECFVEICIPIIGCGCLGGKKDEAYCRNIHGNNPADTRNYNKDVICARQELDISLLPPNWSDWDLWNWNGVYVP